MRYINSVNVTGFRGIKDLSLSDLGDLNILIGASNTGKSSVLEAIFVPLEAHAGEGFESVVQSRSDLGVSMITSLFPDNDYENIIEISLGLFQSENGAEEPRTVDFMAKKADFLINDYQTFLSQFGWTDFQRYSVLEVTVKQTESSSHSLQVALSQID